MYRWSGPAAFYGTKNTVRMLPDLTTRIQMEVADRFRTKNQQVLRTSSITLPKA